MESIPNTLKKWFLKFVPKTVVVFFGKTINFFLINEMDEQQNYALLSKLYIYPGNCICILLTKLPCPGKSEEIFRSSSQAAHAHLLAHCPLYGERQAGKLWIPTL